MAEREESGRVGDLNFFPSSGGRAGKRGKSILFNHSENSTARRVISCSLSPFQLQLVRFKIEVTVDRGERRKE